MTDARCEPPEELRGRDGWHWMRNKIGSDGLAWWCSSRQDWTFAGRGKAESPATIAALGYTHIAPVLTPAEAAALRAERNAARTERDDVRRSFANLQVGADALRARFDDLLVELDAGAVRITKLAVERDDALARAEQAERSLEMLRMAIDSAVGGRPDAG